MSEEKCSVEPWVLLCAIRYGLGRLTYVHGDCIRLIREHWPALRRWEDQIVRSLTEIRDGCNGSAIECGMREECDELLTWIAAQDGPHIGRLWRDA